LIESMEDFKNTFEGSSVNSEFYNEEDLQVFKSLELANYQLSTDFKGAKAAAVLPVGVQKLIGITGKYTPYIGAFPVK